jgi:DNA-binding NarL/FixJ family response regulator
MTASSQHPAPRKPQPRAAARRAPQTPRAARPRIRILVADGYAIDRHGMTGLLQSQRDFEVVADAATIPEAIERWRAHAPDVLVLAQSVPFVEGETAVASVRAALPGARILAIADRSAAHCVVLHPPSRERVEEAVPGRACAVGTDCLQLAFNDGAMGTLRRSASPAELFQAVRALASGVAWLEAGTAARLAGGAFAPDADGDLAFSERELDVAAMIAEGLSNKEISMALRISEPTVKKYVGRIFEKLHVDDRLQAGLFLSRHPLMLRRRSSAQR